MIGDDSPAADGNAPVYSVSDLAFALKRTIEDAYGYVRLRGELSKVTFHGNGHVYLDLKDARACISGVIWRSQVAALAIRPQTGLEVVVTGKVTTYPGRSQYQIVIETMTHAGVGALLAQLERLKAKLTAEGLFDAARKRPLPHAPGVIGVVTSPTGAVIRDILHRVRERWPCRVIVWPVVVQGEQAATQVAAAVRGFAVGADAGVLPRPDLIIVARGGGSVEDLWPFNDEALVRAVAGSPIPIISAVGHETDVTLIDHAADRRAPTPTAAAEIATPVMAELAAAIADRHRRLARAGERVLELRRVRLAGASGRLPKRSELLAIATQRLDLAAGRLDGALRGNLAAHRQAMTAVAAPLRPSLLGARLTAERRRLEAVAPRLAPALSRRLTRAREALASLEKLRRSFDPDRPLSRGFARVHRADGGVATSAAALASGEAVKLVFADGARGAVIDGAIRRRLASAEGTGQGDLF